MKKLINAFLALAAGLAIAGCAKEYDDSALQDKVNNLDKKVTELEKKVNALTEQVTGLATTIDEWKKGGFVESVTDIKEGDTVIGYTVTFVGGKTVVLYNGKDGAPGKDGNPGAPGKDGEKGATGADGQTPTIILYEGNLVWAIGDKPILVDNKPVPANVVPTFAINDEGHLIMTLLGQETDLGKVKGEDGAAGTGGDSILKSIEKSADGKNLVFTLNGDPEVVYEIPFATAFKLVIENTQIEAAAGKTVEIPFKVENGTAEMVDFFVNNSAYEAKIVESKLVVTVPDPFQAAQILVWAQNDKGLSSLVKLSFITAADVVVVTPAEDIAAIPAAAGDFEIDLTSNVDLDAKVPEEATWVKAVVTKADYKLTLTLEENTTAEPREAEIAIVRKDNGQEVKTITIVQLAGVVDPTIKRDVLNNAFTGVDNSSSSYQDWAGKTGTESKAVYAGQTARGQAADNLSIQFRTNNNNSGIITTASGGKLKKVSVTFNKSTTDRILNVYGKNEAYTSPTELYNESTAGTLLGSIQAGTGNYTLDVEGDYTYVAFRSANSAVYVDEIVVTWKEDDAPAPKVLTVERLWGKYSTAEAAWNSYFSGTANSDRNLAMDDDYIYVPESSGTAKIWRIPVDGTSAVSTVNVEGVSGGTHAITCVRMVPNTAAGVNGGKDFLMGVSLTTDDSADALRVYSWGKGTDAAPTKTSAQTWNHRRLGDKFTVYGSLQDGALFFKDYANASSQGAFMVLRMAWSEVPQDGFFNPRRTNMFVEDGMGAYYPYPGDATNGIYTSTASSKYTSFTSSPLNTSPNETGTFTDAGGYYVNAHGFNYFEYNGKRYIAYVKNAGDGDGRFYVIEGESTTSWADMLGSKRNVIYQAAIQEDLAFKDGDYHAELGANPSPKTSGNSGIDCAVRIKDDAVYFAVMKQHVGLSLFKMSMK